MRERRRTPRVAAAAVSGLLLAGCSGLPTSGPVVAGPEAVAPRPAPQFLADRATQGMTPRALVEGFLRAAASVEDDYAVARTYLTDPEADAWRPTDSTVVYTEGALAVDTGVDPSRADLAGDAGDGSGGAQLGTVRSVTVSVVVEGDVDADGRWTTAPPSTTREIPFELLRTSQGWRLADLPDGVLIGGESFRQLYRAYELYFLDPSRTTLVPELRWFPGRSATATLLAGELLAGPSDWLSGAVGSAFPPATELVDPPTVPLQDDGTAVVDLTQPARRADVATRELMQEQMLATLRFVPGVRTVQLAVGGDALQVSGGEPLLRRDPAVTGDPVALAGDELVRLAPTGPDLEPDAPDLAGQDPSQPAVGEDGTLAVLVDGGSRLLVRPAGGSAAEAAVVLSGQDLVTPSVDPLGWVWSSPASSGAQVTAVRADGTTATVEAPFLQGRTLVSLHVSRDGARAVVSSTSADGQGHLDVVGVVRDGGAPVALQAQDSPPLPQLRTVGESVWVDQSTVAVLASDATAGALRLWVLAVDGSTLDVQDVPTGVSAITAARGSRYVLASTGDGSVYQRAGRAWVPLASADGARQPAYAG